MDEQTYTVTDEQLLNVFASGASSGTGTFVNRYIPGVTRDQAAVVARVATEQLADRIRTDPGLRDEVLTTLHAMLRGDEEPIGRWVRA